MVGGNRQEALDIGFVLVGTRQQGVSAILKELMSPLRFEPTSPIAAVRDVTTELFGLAIHPPL